MNIANNTIANITDQLDNHGVFLLRNSHTNINDFTNLLDALCSEIYFDPARNKNTKNTQTVDAGREAIGLHIENGNTPLPPDTVAFYSEKSAEFGSQTTWCDGVALYQNLPENLQKKFLQPIVVTRNLPRIRWATYVAEVLHIDNPSSVTQSDLHRLFAQVPGQSATFDEDENCLYSLMIQPTLLVKNNGQRAFANALLGPSFNYEKPNYRFDNGEPVSEQDIALIRSVAEQHTQEVAWRNGDILLLDNKRIMHGRRSITCPSSNRVLHVGMGKRH